jgi:hypothetical protein
VPPSTSRGPPGTRPREDGRAAANLNVITVASHTKKDNPAGLPLSPSSPPTTPGGPYILTGNAAGQRAAEGVISAQQAEDLVRQLQDVAQAGGLVEHPERPQVVDVTTYYRRNQDVVDVADELLVFQVNDSGGVQDTVDRARAKGIPVVVFTYQAQ